MVDEPFEYNKSLPQISRQTAKRPISLRQRMANGIRTLLHACILGSQLLRR